MALPVRNTKDFWAGVIYLVVGLGALIIARDYGMGTATRMGPGYFPIVLGALLALIGSAAVLRSFFAKPERVGTFALKGMLVVFVATVLFAVLLRGGGFIVALSVLVVAGSYASVKFRWGWALTLAAGLVTFCVIVFVYALGVPLPLLGSWIAD